MPDVPEDKEERLLVLKPDPRGSIATRLPSRVAPSSPVSTIVLLVGAIVVLAMTIAVVFGTIVGERMKQRRGRQGTVGPDTGSFAPAPPMRTRRVPPERSQQPGDSPALADGAAAWITNEDYPGESIRREEQGTTQIRWRIGTDGRVAECGTVSSSGFPRLDDAACRAIVLRARYRPARNAAGAPIAVTQTRRVVWRLPE